MKLIAGLGNPGRRYAGSRHNIGFTVVDELARRWGVTEGRHEARFQGYLGEGVPRGERTLLLKPLTYMNLSGRSVGAVQRFYKLEISDVLVIYDDLDLPLGRIRVRRTGSAGGQKGMADVLRHLGTQDVHRIRVGIGKVHPSATTEYVLARFEPSEREDAEFAVKAAADAAETWLYEGVEAAMNRFNGK